MSALSSFLEPTSIQWVQVRDQINRLHRETLKPSNSLKFCVSKIRELGSFLARLPEVSVAEAVTNQRLRYLGKEIEAIMPKGVFHGIHGVEALGDVITVACLIYNLKNALQVEAYFFGNIFHKLTESRKAISYDTFQKFKEEIPGMIEKIDSSHFSEGYYAIDATPFDCYLGEEGFDKTANLFDITALTILSKFSIVDGKIIIPVDHLPTLEILDLLPSLEIYRYADEVLDPTLDLLLHLLFIIIEDAKIANIRQENKAPVSGESCADYLLKEEFIPYYCEMIKTRVENLTKKESFFWIPKEDDFICKFSESIPSNWLEQSSLVYDVLLELSKDIDYLLDKTKKNYSLVIPKNQFELASDKELLFLNDKKITFNPPIHSKKPFCLSKEEFLRIPEHLFTQPIDLLDLDSAVRGPKAKSPKKSKKTVSRPKVEKKSPAKGPSKTLFASPEEIESLVETTSISSLSAAGGETVSTRKSEVLTESLVKTTSMASLSAAGGGSVSTRKSEILTESLVAARMSLDAIQIHPRVGSWLISASKGLEYYDFYNKEAGHVLTEREMILRHRFPKAILFLIFNPFYSKEIDCIKGVEDGFKKRKCLVSINGKKYFIEAIVDQFNVLFHLYGKPIRSLNDYVEFTSQSPSEFPPLKADETTAAAIAGSYDEIVFNKTGDAVINFDGLEYKVVLLNNSF